jgi:hypothetical protein
MTNERTLALVFKDQAGEYYLVPEETLERGRVPAEHKAALEAQFAALAPAPTEGDDVQGYAAPVVVPYLVGIAAGLTVRWLTTPGMPAKDWASEVYGINL